MIPLSLHADRLFPADPATRDISRRLYETVRDLPILAPHGHTDPKWFAENERFSDPSTLLIVPDHNVFRMLYSQGVRLEDLGVPRRDGGPTEAAARDLASVRCALPSVPLHADPHLARSRVQCAVRHRRAADGRGRGHLSRLLEERLTASQPMLRNSVR